MELQDYYVSTAQLAALCYGPQETHIIASRTRKNAELANGTYVDWLTLARYDIRVALHVLPEAVTARLGDVNALYDDALHTAGDTTRMAAGLCAPAPAFIQSVASENLIWRVWREFATLATIAAIAATAACHADDAALLHAILDSVQKAAGDTLLPAEDDATPCEVTEILLALLASGATSITIKV